MGETTVGCSNWLTACTVAHDAVGIARSVAAAATNCQFSNIRWYRKAGGTTQAYFIATTVSPFITCFPLVW